MKTKLEVTTTPDGMAKVVVTNGLCERVVWLGAGRSYKVDPLPGDDRIAGAKKGQIGRTCVLVDLLLECGARQVRVRWDDTGRKATITPRDLVLIPGDTPMRVVSARGGRVARGRMARGRALDRHDDNIVERVDDRLTKAAEYTDGDKVIEKIENRADKRRLCEMCQRVHVAGRMFRACRFCWVNDGYPNAELMDERLNALAYERHVKGIPERWRA